jgi:hypothetical protein
LQEPGNRIKNKGGWMEAVGLAEDFKKQVWPAGRMLSTSTFVRHLVSKKSTDSNRTTIEIESGYDTTETDQRMDG